MEYFLLMKQFVVGFTTPSSHLFFPAVVLFILAACGWKFSKQAKRNLPPAVPGMPFLGNLIQMTTEKPHLIFSKWSELYGPIFTIKTGEVMQVIITSPELAKEVLVTKYTSIANRSTGTNINTLTRDRRIVAMFDYGDRYRFIKKLLVTSLLGQTPQKALRAAREKYLYRSLDSLFDDLNGSTGVANVRNYLNNILFPLALHQMFGRDVQTVDVPELGGVITQEHMMDTLVHDCMRGAVRIDWRDFFPSLKWIPNKSLELDLKQIDFKRSLLLKALIEDHKRLSESRKEECYCDVLLKHSKDLTEDEFLLGVWEPIIESSDTTLVTAEWALYELAKHPTLQEKLYNEISGVVGDRMVNEDDLPKLPYLNAVVKETLRMYTPAPILPPRYVSETVELGGYTIPAGFQVIVNMYGINHDKKIWKDPETWDPSRMLDPKIDMGVKDMRLIPFGGGRRICAGMTQAFYIVPMIIAIFIQHFQWSLPDSAQTSKADVDTLYFTSQKLHPLQAIAKPRVLHRIERE